MTGLQSLTLKNNRITDLAPLAGMTWLQNLNLENIPITDLAPLAGLTGLQNLNLENIPITDLTPLAGLTGLRNLDLNNTRITDHALLAGMTGLRRLTLKNTQITDLSPIAGLTKLETLQIDQTRVSDLRPVAVAMAQTLGIVHRRILTFSETAATEQDAYLAELAQIKDGKERTRETLAYLRSLPPWPEPYTPAATPDGSPPQPIGGESIDAQAQALSDLTPLAEELTQDPETGRFSVKCKPVEKPDLLSATLGQVADAIEDVLHDPRNGLNETSLDIRKLTRTLERYANDPQRIEMDFTTVHHSLTRQIAIEDLPPSDENLALLSALEEGAQGIRATDAAVAVNRRILQEQKLRELPPDAIATIRESAPILQAITEGDMAEQSAEDVDYLTTVLPSAPPRLPGVTRDDAIVPGRDEAVRLFGRSSRMLIMLRRSGTMIRKLHDSTPFQAAEIMQTLTEIVRVGLSFIS
ncbi:leucine-rich repeat domain-containing protein [Rhodobacteraceae bacterium 2376]|uniref:Leucine-rich repeat domain-containing protein n=2 Tax=Rhabdonatronobacter sediminivivens TaxID=2743469 RepID=A0A7Z0I273_9RHOB|nr:leucine-rich repeat domain-containing protein [Rhabdonatronobacter sediminivivens]